MALQHAVSHSSVGAAVGEPVGCAVGELLGDGVGDKDGEGVVGDDVLGIGVGDDVGWSEGGVLGLVGIQDHHGDDSELREHSSGRSKASFTDNRVQSIMDTVQDRREEDMVERGGEC